MPVSTKISSKSENSALLPFAKCGGVEVKIPVISFLPWTITLCDGKTLISIPPTFESRKNPPSKTFVTVNPISSIWASIKTVFSLLPFIKPKTLPVKSVFISST